MLITLTLNTKEIDCLSLEEQYDALAGALRNEADNMEIEGPCEGTIEDCNGNELGRLEVFD